MDQTSNQPNGPVNPPPTSPVATGSCPSCARPSPNSSSYVYALGRIHPRFPSLAVEKEFAQVTGRSDTSGLTDREALHAVCSQKENRYLVRQLCWVLAIEGLDTYILQPRDPEDYDSLVGALRPTPAPHDVDVVVGLRGPNAPQQMCNGMMLPIVGFDQIYSFDRDSLIGSLPKPDKTGAKEFNAAAIELLDRVLQMADNTGAADEHRALNYLVVRYPAIYARTAEAYAGNASLSAVSVRPSTLSGGRMVAEVIFSFTNRNTDVTEKSFVRVDVTEEFPFLVTKLSPYFDR